MEMFWHSVVEEKKREENGEIDEGQAESNSLCLRQNVVFTS